jgi:DNA polymerase III subunit epsilon
MLFLSLDFETTGLNTAKDDPIQIGFLIFDIQGTIKATYSSLIKPNKSTTELKEIVQYVTGFDIATLQYAPNQKQVFSEVVEYLKDDLIIVGHNISFDIAILKRFLPNREPKASIDTFDCARQLLHFQQSYALDALIQLDQNQQLGIFSTITGKAHDALYDATASMQLFLWWIRETSKIAKKYPLLASVFFRNTTTKIIFEKLCNTSNQISTLTLPALQ